MKTSLLSMALCAVAAISQAAPITYNVNLSIPASAGFTVTLNGTITTDGTIGTIATSNITSFSLTQAYSSFSVLIASPSPVFANLLGATATELRILAGGTFQIGASPDVGLGFRLASPGGSDPVGGRVNFDSAGNLFLATGQPAPYLLGTAPASSGGGGQVPEPSTMGLMGVGLATAFWSRSKWRAKA